MPQPNEMVRCSGCGHIEPMGIGNLCVRCTAEQGWDEDDDFPSSPLSPTMFVAKRELPEGEDGQPIPGTYILCYGRKQELLDPNQGQPDRGPLGPLFA